MAAPQWARGAYKIRPLENESSPTTPWGCSPPSPAREQSSGIKRRNIRANVSVRRWPLTDGQFLKTIPSAYLFLPSPMEILVRKHTRAFRLRGWSALSAVGFSFVSFLECVLGWWAGWRVWMSGEFCSWNEGFFMCCVRCVLNEIRKFELD